MSEEWFRDRVRAIPDPAPATLPLSGIMARGVALRRRERRRRTALGSAAAAAVLLTGGGLMAGWPGGTGAQTVVASGPQGLSPVVREGVADRARDALEGEASTALEPGGALACAVHVLGTDPENLAEVADARTVYVWAHCATVGTQVRTEMSLPAAVHLTTPPTAEVPRDGSLYAPDVRRIFPERLRASLDASQAYVEELEAEVGRRLRDRS